MNKQKTDNLKKAADWVMEQHIRRNTFCPVPENYGVETIEDAYIVQESLIEGWEKTLGPVVGYKLALTSAPIQKLVGLDHPCIGRLYKSQIQYGNKCVNISEFSHLGLEFELAVRVGSDMPKTSVEWTSENVKEYIDSVSAAFELIDDRYADYRDLQVNSLISDNSWFAGAVLAEESKEWRKLDFQNLMVKKTINNSIETSTTGAALGNPFNSVAWIANFLNKQGRLLKAGELLMTGSTFATMFPNIGDKLSYEVDCIGTIELEVFK